MKNYILLLMVFFAFNTIFGQDRQSEIQKHEIGMAAGWSTGYGISYRYWPGKFGIQLTTTPYFEKEYSTASFGVTGLMSLSEIPWMRVYLYLGNHYMYYRQLDYYIWDNNGNLIELQNPNNSSYGRYIVGIGPGFEFLLGKKFGLNLMFGFRSDWSTYEYKISITGETGLYYRF